MAELARPLIAAMLVDAFGEPYLCVDATGVLVLAKEKCRHGHFWVLVAPEKHVLYGYSKQHNGAAVDEPLKGDQGYLVADAHSVYTCTPRATSSKCDAEVDNVLDESRWRRRLATRAISASPCAASSTTVDSS